MNTPSLRAVIFDLDGTLVDSRLDFSAMRCELDAPPDVGLLEYVETLDTEAAQAEAMAVIHRHEMTGAETATWMPGAEDVMHGLHNRRTPIAIVTRNSREAAKLTMRRLGMPDVPLKAREDAAPKPDPEALLALAQRWGLAPSVCAYVGDFRYDIEAAERAGMLPVLYTAGQPVPSEHEGKVAVLSDFRTAPGWLTQADAGERQG
ncbi:MAG: HAD family hydrolase [Pseudomonadota bacterium]